MTVAVVMAGQLVPWVTLVCNMCRLGDRGTDNAEHISCNGKCLESSPQTKFDTVDSHVSDNII